MTLTNPYFNHSGNNYGVLDSKILNPYFSFQGQCRPNDNETMLYKNLQREHIACMGFALIYIPRTLVDVDYLLGEDLESKFENGFKFAAYINDFSGFQPGDSDMASKFGLIVRDKIEIQIAKAEWDALKANNSKVPDQPREGDLIYFPTAGKEVLEISWVDDEKEFYPLRSQMTWALKATTFQYNGQTFDSGFEEVDNTNKHIPSNDFNEILENKFAQTVSDPFKKFDVENPFGEF